MKLTALGAALLLFGSTAAAQTAEAPKPTWTFAMKGFVSMTGGYQTGSFAPSEGQLSNTATTPATFKDDSSFTFDVRHSRFNFSVKGPATKFGATPAGILEIDFMGGFGAGNNGNTSLVNRLRVAVVELTLGNHKLQFGQQNDLIFAMAPTSLSHIGQPLGYGTGNIGFRRPGVFGFHTLPVSKDLSGEFAWEIGRASWADAGGVGAAAPTAPSGGFTAGEASGAPAFEGRATVNYAKLLTVWAATHQQRVDLTGAGNGTAAASNSLTVACYNAGLKAIVDVQPVTITLAGTGFVAQNAAPLAANLGAGYAARNVDSSGYWAQLGLNVTKEISFWGLYGQQFVEKKDFVRGGAAAGSAYENATTNVIAMYRDPGGVAFSLEWINFATKIATALDTTNNKITTSRTAKADQYLLSANYFF